MSKNIRNKFYNFSFNESKKETDLYLYGEIVSSEDDKWSEDDVCFQDFKSVLDVMGNEETLNIHVNSPGGSVFASSAIVTLLKSAQRKGVKINSYLDSLSASCASWIPLVADNVYIYKNTIMMLHKPMAGYMVGANAEDMKKEIEILNKIEDSVMLPLYMEKVKDGITEEYIKDLLKEETWLSSDEILNIFDFELLEDIKDYVACCIDKDVMKNYVNIPENIKDLLRKEEESLSKEVKNSVEEVEQEEATVETTDVNEVENEPVDETVEETTDENEEVKEDVVEDSSEISKDDLEENSKDDSEKETLVSEENPVAEPGEGGTTTQPWKPIEPGVIQPSEIQPSEKTSISKDVEEEEENIQKKLEKSNEMIISLNEKIETLNEKIKSLEVIEKEYNAIKEAENKAEIENKVKEKYSFYKNKFEKFDALDRFESEEIQSLINNCISDKKCLSKLNQLVVDMIENEVSTSKVVNINSSQMGTEINNLIPDRDGSLSSLFED